jgi:hypothetical protein
LTDKQQLLAPEYTLTYSSIFKVTHLRVFKLRIIHFELSKFDLDISLIISTDIKIINIDDVAKFNPLTNGEIGR